MTVAEVAAVLRCSTKKVYALAEGGQLAHIRVGVAIRVELGAVREFKRRGGAR